MGTNDDSNDKEKSTEDENIDDKFQKRLEKYVQTVQAWDKDPSLLEECRIHIPWDELRRDDNKTVEKKNKYDHDTKRHSQGGNVLLLQRLCRFFQGSMTWINAPPCNQCGGTECTYSIMRGPETEEERNGGASRVEGESFNRKGKKGKKRSGCSYSVLIDWPETLQRQQDPF